MHLNLAEPLALPFTSQSSSKNLSDVCSEKWGETCYPDPCWNLGTTQRALTSVCVCVSVSPGTCVQWGWCQISVVAHSPACPIDPHSLSSRDTEQVWALVLCFSVSPLLNLHLRFHQRNHSDLSQQDFLNQQRRGRVWAVLHSSWWNVIWWYRELNTVILNLGTTRDCFLFLTSRF